MRLACRETLQQAVNMAAARTVSELLWSIFCPFELLGRPAQVKSPIPPLTSNGAEPRKRASRLFFTTGGTSGRGKTSGIREAVSQRFAPFFMSVHRSHSPSEAAELRKQCCCHQATITTARQPR